jgi:hypothetical protein
MTHEQKSRRPRFRFATLALALLGASSVACGHHASRLLPPLTFVGRPPDSWPASTKLARDTGKATLIMFANPHCPCTRASLADLREVMVGRENSLKVYIVFVIPKWVDPTWLEGEDLQIARGLKGATVVFQTDTFDAKQFDAKVSGSVVLYDANGRFGFRGGITGLRGLAGDNVGQQRLVAVLDGKVPEGRETRVFGCALYDRATMTR